jgi:hypothetical protein
VLRGLRVRSLVARAGGAVREEAAVRQLATAYGRAGAHALHRALWDAVVHRGYLDGHDALILPDEDGAG